MESATDAAGLPEPLAGWFAERGWRVRRHQSEMLAAARAGQSALLVAPTGAGKTLAGFLPSLAELAERPSDGLHTLYVSPLKALAVDVQRNLLAPIAETGLPIRVETRTGDTPACPKCQGQDLERLLSMVAMSSEHTRQLHFNRARQAARKVQRDKDHAQWEYEKKHREEGH